MQSGRKGSKFEKALLKKKKNEGDDAVEKFFECYSNIVRHCERVERDISRGSSSYTTAALLENLKLHQYELCEVSDQMKNTAIAEVSTDLLSLENRIQTRLKTLIMKLGDDTGVLKTSHTTELQLPVNNDVTQDNEDSICSPHNQKLNASLSKKTKSHYSLNELEAGITVREISHHEQSLAKSDKDEGSESYHNSVPIEYVIESTHNIRNSHDNRSKCANGIDNGAIEQLNTVSQNPVDDFSKRYPGDIVYQGRSHLPVHNRDDTLKSNHSHLSLRTTSSRKLSQLVQQREQVEYQINITRQEAQKRALEASRERLHQMELEQELMNMQREIDELSHDESNDLGHPTDWNEDTKYQHHGQPPYSAPPAEIDLMAQVFADAINLNKLPVPEPPIFYGNPLEYPGWRSSFDTLIGSKRIEPGEKIHYLKRYLGSDAKSCVEGMFLFNTEAAYTKARNLLEKRFGNDFAISEAFRDKLYSWQSIAATDSDALRKYSDFLQQCELAKECIKGLDCLDDCRENRKMLTKLPDYLIVKWNRIISEFTGYFPPFSTFASFIAKEADVACNPITSLNAVRALSKGHDIAEVDEANTLVSVQSNTATSSCRYCHRTNHKLHNCNDFKQLEPEERSEFLQRKRLCYGCLEFGHFSKDCKMKKTCKVCTKRHPTCLHGDYEAITKNKDVEKQASKATDDDHESRTNDGLEEGRTFHVSQGNANSGMIVPVYVSNIQSPDKEILTYALLDTQSDSTFVLDQIGDALETDKSCSTVKLSTLTSTDTLNCFKYNNLQVRGLNRDVQIPLPCTYARDDIPGNPSHIPSQRTALKWPHLRQLRNQIPELLNCGIGLLIGYNCPQALAPRDFISGEGNVPFALETVLGWSIVGITGAQDRSELCSISHKIMMTETDAKVVEDSPNSSHSRLRSDVRPLVQTSRGNKNTKLAATMYTTRDVARFKIRPHQLEITQHSNKRGMHIDPEPSASPFGDDSYIVGIKTNGYLRNSKHVISRYKINLDNQVYRGECKCTCR